MKNRQQRINVVLTGKSASKSFFRVAEVTGGETLTDLTESGEILAPYLEVSVIGM